MFDARSRGNWESILSGFSAIGIDATLSSFRQKMTTFTMGPEHTISHIERVRRKPPTWMVVCSCREWSRRIVGSEGKTRQAHWRHRNDFVDPTESPSIREAWQRLADTGLDPASVRSEGRFTTRQCPGCHGTGDDDSNDPDAPCGVCDGEGVVRETNRPTV